MRIEKLINYNVNLNSFAPHSVWCRVISGLIPGQPLSLINHHDETFFYHPG